MANAWCHWAHDARVAARRQAMGLGWIPGDARRAVGDRRLPLQQFLRLMAGARMADRPAVAASNEDLVAHLRKTGAIKQ